jgi:hypothetical protein
VDTLILAGSHTWDADLIRSIFYEDTAAKILRVPIIRLGGEDFVSWPYTHFGVYTVRSAYNLARTDQFRADRNQNGNGSSSVTVGDTKAWKKLWSDKVPGKMKITYWRFAHNCLPSGSQARSFNIGVFLPPTSAFSVANTRQSSTRFSSVNSLVRFGGRSNKSSWCIYADNTFTFPRVWVLDFLKRGSELELTTVMTTLWHIWDARNKAREDDILMHPGSIATKVKAYIEMILQHLYKPILTTGVRPLHRATNGLRRRQVQCLLMWMLQSSPHQGEWESVLLSGITLDRAWHHVAYFSPDLAFR